ncbi:MAG: phosphopantothenoylcysteine decarboxylase [Lysobacterales bacterium]|jgi:phosphopantothenoylcysteine decarboxylase/phosphopantothenate--cysteine ligase
MKILVTAGGTEEPLDGVRYIGNLSTGLTGLNIARTFGAHGWDVYLLHGRRVDVSGLDCETNAFRTFDDLGSSLKALLETHHFDAVVHLAAVSDYRLASIELDGEVLPADTTGKIESGHELVLRLAPNPKLLDSLKQWSANPDIRIVAFKLTNDPDPARRKTAIEDLLARGTAEFVVHNDLGEIGEHRHRAAIYTRTGLLGTAENKTELAGMLVHILHNGER